MKRKLAIRRLTPSPLVGNIIGGIFLAAAMAVLLYYIQGPSLGIIHSDCTDSLLWSKVWLDTGSVLSADFHYAALLPFGTPLWTTPILALCGYSVTAYVLSMSVFAVLFALSAWSLFRALRWNALSAGIATFCTCMLLSGSDKIREIMWQHTIYYSLSILLVMLMLNLVLRVLSAWECAPDTSKARKWTLTAVWGVLLLLLTIGAATDGFQILSLTAVPVIGALLLQVWTDRRPLFSRRAWHRYAVCGVLFVGMIVGLLVLNALTNGGEIKAGYEDAYSVWSGMENWWNNATHFLPHYLTLFGVRIDAGDPLFCINSLNQIIKMAVGLVVLVLPIIGLVRIGKMDRPSRLLLWSYVLVSGVTLFGFICGTLSNANWRLTPFLGMSVIASLVTVKDFLGREIAWRRLGALGGALLVFCGMIFARTMLFTPPKDTLETRPETRVIEILEQKGYTEGYASFWNSQILTLLSDGQVQMLSLTVDGGTITPNTYQHYRSQFAERTEADRPAFLLLTAYEYETTKGLGGFDEMMARETLVDAVSVGDYRILMFENNPFV